MGNSEQFWISLIILSWINQFNSLGPIGVGMYRGIGGTQVMNWGWDMEGARLSPMGKR